MKLVSNTDLYEMLDKNLKQKHQVKSRWYYIFWGAATVSVFAGQLYVGSGYRKMSNSLNRIIDPIVLEIERMQEETFPTY